MSAANIPSSLAEKKCGSRAYYDAFEAPNPVGELSPIVSGIFNKNSVKRLNEPELTPKFASEGFRAERPPQKALAVVSKKLSTANIYHLSRQERIGYIGNTNQNHAVSPVSSNAIDTATKSQKKTRNQKKRYFSEEMNIRDADYVEMVDELGLSKKSDKYNMPKELRTASEVPRKASKEQNNVWITGGEDTSSRKFRKAPAKDARDLGLAQRTKSVEPSAISAISETKTKAKQSLKKRPSKPVPTAADAFDYVIDTFRGKPVNKYQTQKVKHSLKSNIICGIQGINQVTEEISKNGNIQRIKQQQESDIKALQSANRHFKNSIAATGNNSRKQQMTAGSLITQYVIATTNNTTTTATNPTNQYGITAKYERRSNGHGHVELHFYYSGRRISHSHVSKILTHKQINTLKINALANGTLAPHTQANTTVNSKLLDTKRIKTASKLVRRNTGGLGNNKKTNGTLNKPKLATASGLVTNIRERNYGF